MSQSSPHSPDLEARSGEVGEVCRTPTSRLSRPSSVSDLVLERLGNLTGIMERQNVGQAEIMHTQSEMNDRLESLANRMDRIEGSPLRKFAVGSTNPGYGMAMAAFCPTAADIDHSALGLRGSLDDVRLHPEPLGYPGTVRRSGRLSLKPRPDYAELGGKPRTLQRVEMSSNPTLYTETRSPSPGISQQHVQPASVDESTLGGAILRRGDGITILHVF